MLMIYNPEVKMVEMYKTICKSKKIHIVPLFGTYGVKDGLVVDVVSGDGGGSGWGVPVGVQHAPALHRRRCRRLGHGLVREG